MSEKKLLSQFLELNFDANSYSSVNEASNAAISQALPTDVVYIGGSTFVVAEIF